MPSLRTTRARELRNNMTVTERRLWSRLRLRQLEGWKFRRPAPIGDYFVDFVCLAARLVVELDGSTHDDLKDAYDRRRQTWLESEGYKVLRFTAGYDDMDYLEGVVEAIYLELTQCQSGRPLPREAEDDLINAHLPAKRGGDSQSGRPLPGKAEDDLI